MPIKLIHHVDLAVSDVERTLAFYLAVLGPLGMEEDCRYPSYRGSEEVVYLRAGEQLLGFRQADGGEHRYYEVGLEHLALVVDTRQEVEDTYARCLELGVESTFRPRTTATSRVLGAVLLRPRRHAHRGGVLPARGDSGGLISESSVSRPQG